MKKRTMLRTWWLMFVRWLRADRLLWRCPKCRLVRRWGTEHLFDTYPMLENMWHLPACCRQEFPLWAYGSGMH